MGKLLIITGIILILIGLLLQYANKIPLIGKLPGDIVIDKGNFKFYFPITTCILLSILVTLLMYIIKWWKS